MAHAEATKGRNIRGLAVYTRGTQAHPGPHCYVHKWFNSNVLYDPHQAAPCLSGFNPTAGIPTTGWGISFWVIKALQPTGIGRIVGA